MMLLVVAGWLVVERRTARVDTGDAAEPVPA